MLDRLITFALQERVFVLAVSLAVGIAGWAAWKNLPVEAFPDVQDVQVQILTQVPGQAPEEVIAMTRKFIEQNRLEDLDGDALPELLRASDAGVTVFPNLGGLAFGPGELRYDGSTDGIRSGSVSVGDLDGDDDLDLVLPAGGFFGEEDSVRPPHRVLYQEDGQFVVGAELADGTSSFSLLTGIPASRKTEKTRCMHS